MKSLLTLVLVLASVHSYAFRERMGQEGNGGDVVVCSGNKSPILLDFYEWELLNGKIDTREIKITHKSGQNHYIDIALAVLDRYDKIDDLVVEELRKDVLEFNKNVFWHDGANLPDIPDSDHVVLEDGCEIQQLVIQRKPIHLRERLYTVDRDLWNKMDDFNKAGTVLHEVIYKKSLAEGHINSIRTRAMNGMINSPDLQNYKTSYENFKFLYEYMGYRSFTILGSKYVYDTHNESQVVFKRAKTTFKELKFNHGLSINVTHNYTPRYRFKQAKFFDDERVANKVFIQMEGQHVASNSHVFDYDSDRNLRIFYVEQGAEIQYRGEKYSLKQGDVVVLDTKGDIVEIIPNV